jgi:small subunit ribosomal protein S8
MANAKTKNPNKVSNDPVSDFLTRLRNAILVSKKQVSIPYSKLKHNLAELLRNEGYINSYSIANEDNLAIKSIVLDIKYQGSKPSIQGLKRISKPGLRKYSKAKYAPRVLNGLGISVLSTSQGLMSDRKARKSQVGGEVICQVW